MNKHEAMVAATSLYKSEFGNVPVIAEKLSMVTTLTRRRARVLMQDAIIEYIADLLQDNQPEEIA